MATNTRKKSAPADKFIKVRAADHTFIKIQAAGKGKTMGTYLSELSRKDAGKK